MNKKIFAFLFAVIVVLSFGIIANAQVVVYTDTFDDMTPGLKSEIGTSQTLNIGCTALDKIYTQGGAVEIIEDGYKGNAIKFTEDGGSKPVTLYTKETTAGKAAYVNFKFKMLDDVNQTANLGIRIGSSDNFFYIKKNGDSGKLWPSNDTAAGQKGRMPYTIGKWYDFTFKFTPATETTPVRVDVTVIDEDGNETTGYKEGLSSRFISFMAYDPVVAGVSFVIDELRVYELDDVNEMAAVEQTTLPENIGALSRKPEFNIGFNYPMFTESAIVTVTDENGTPVPDTSFIAKAAGRSNLNVKFSQLLEKGKNYTLTVSNLKNLNGVLQEAVSVDFTTEYARKLSAASKSAETVSDKTRVTINFDNAADYAATPVRAMAVIYDGGKMTSLEYVTATVDIYGTLVADFASVTPESDFSVLVFDDSNTLIPVSEAVCFE